MIAACLVIALLGTILLYIYTLTIQPNIISISEALVTREGKLIQVTGEVKSIELGSSFSKIIICDSTLDLCISARFSNDLFPAAYNVYEGDTVTAKGLVKEYYSNKYLEVKSEGDLIKLK